MKIVTPSPAAAILEDRVRKAAAGALAKNAKTTFLWTTRAADEIAAFAYLFNSVAALPAKERALFDIRVFRTGASAAMVGLYTLKTVYS